MTASLFSFSLFLVLTILFGITNVRRYFSLLEKYYQLDRRGDIINSKHPLAKRILYMERVGMILLAGMIVSGIITAKTHLL